MTRRLVTFLLFLGCISIPARAADANNFILIRGGKTVGKASYAIDKTKDGFRGKARFEYHMAAAISAGNTPALDSSQANMIVEAQYTSDYKVDANGNYLSGYTQNSTTQTLESYQPDKARTTVTIADSQAGVSQSKSLAMANPNYTVVPDYDPSALQIFLTTATSHPHSDSKYTFIVPGNNRAATVVYVALQPAPDDTGTLNGKPVALKHYQLQYFKGMGDLYTDADGNLMQAVIPTISASYIRVGFALASH